MQRWDPLNERQLLALRRIGDGDDLGDPESMALRHSGRALQGRGLVTISRRGGGWQAAITEDGRFYLEHGQHPDHPDRRRSEPVRPSVKSPVGAADPRRSERSVREDAQDLIDRIVREGGTLTIEEPDDESRARYRRVVHAAKQYALVPDGMHLKHTGRNSGALIMRLTDDAAPDDTDWNRVRLNVRRDTTDPSLVFAALEKDPANLNVTAESVARAVSVIRALAAEARRHGMRVGVNTKTVHPRVYLQTGEGRRAIMVHEEYDTVPHVPTSQELRETRRKPWIPIPKTDSVASGRLRLEIARAGYNKHDSWTDTKRTTLEQSLPRIIRDVIAGQAADEEAKREAKRKHDEYLAELERERLETERRWRADLDAARPRASEALRRTLFRKAYDAWTAAEEIRAFCDAIEQSNPADGETDPDNRDRWIAWARAAADEIDPTIGKNALVARAFDIEPSPNDLRPYIGDWSPDGPHREYRYGKDQERHAAARDAAAGWHHGMLGKPTWWRK
jgi:hypothetical protein